MEDLATVEARLIGAAWTSPDVYANLAQLCAFGSRFGGTPSEQQARDWLQSKLSEYGLHEVHLETFTYTGWRRGICQVAMTAPKSVLLPSAISLVYSPSTSPGGLEAVLVDAGMGTEEEFARLPSSVAGKVVLTTSASPEGAGVWIHRREKYGRAVAGGAAGFLFANHLPGQLAPTGSLRSGRVAEIPAAGLSREDGFRLSSAARQGSVQVRMVIQNETGPAEASHVVGEVPGDPGQEVIVVGAHYDGHDIAEGAMDNGSGVAVLLELARIFAPLAGQLRRTIRFVCFAVEELGVLGSTQYVQAHEDELDEVALMVNLDGGVAGGLGGFFLNGFEELRPLLQGYIREMRYPLNLLDRIPTAADHFPFVLAGIPSLMSRSRSRSFKEGRGFGHTAADTLDKVEERDLHEAAMTAARVLLRLAQEPGSLGRRRSRPEVRQMLIDHDLEHPLRAQDKWPF